MDTTTMSDTERLIQRLEEALTMQDEREGKIAVRPTMSYCFECDEIGFDKLWPSDDCLDHKTVSSDGYEHNGIGSAITTLRYLQSDSDTDD